MNDRFRIDFEWLAREHGSDLERATLAELTFHVDGKVATRVEDTLSKTVRDHVRGSAYLLAQWLAANWWRLRHEPESFSTHSWKMSHILGAVGGGYVWPHLVLNGDGNTMLVQCRPTPGIRGESIRYLASLDLVIPIGDFMRGVDEFIDAVVVRLHDCGQSASDLSVLWAEVRKERTDDTVTAWRRIESMLGYDPDEAPAALLEGLRQQASIVGSAAIEEVASAAGAKALDQLATLTGEVRARAVELEVPDCDTLGKRLEQELDPRWLPWQQAARAAGLARDHWALTPGPIGNAALAERFAIPEHTLLDTAEVPLSRMAAGFRSDSGNGTISIAINKRRATGRRFALARLVADHLHAGPDDQLLPATDAKTARQKFQRAFAQEFLCPYEALADFIGTDEPTDDDIEDAAAFFEVSPMLVKTTLFSPSASSRFQVPGSWNSPKARTRTP